jgi:predicted transcriptional regulator of viral defense system
MCFILPKFQASLYQGTVSFCLHTKPLVVVVTTVNQAIQYNTPFSRNFCLIYLSVCVCVCVCERERERERRMDNIVVNEAVQHGMQITDVEGTRATVSSLEGVIFEVTLNS